MANNLTSTAELAAQLAGNPKVQKQVEQEIRNSKLVSTLIIFRTQKNLSQKEIADAMGCTASKISKLESGNDQNLKWGDIVSYLAALEIKTSILFDDETLPAAYRIKHRVLEIHRLLEGLADLAQSVNDDKSIVDKIHQFYGEVLFNFLVHFEANHDLLKNAIDFPDLELDGTQLKELTQDKDKNSKPEKALAIA